MRTFRSLRIGPWMTRYLFSQGKRVRTNTSLRNYQLYWQLVRRVGSSKDTTPQAIHLRGAMSLVGQYILSKYEGETIHHVTSIHSHTIS